MKHESTTVTRKLDHIRICLENNIEFNKSNGFEKYDLIHNALPELDYDDIDTSTSFLGKKFCAPIFVTGMTGGGPGTRKINVNIAKAVQSLGLGMGVGSQRAAIENPKWVPTYMVREFAPNILLLGNLGGAQLVEYDIMQLEHAVEMIEADGLAIHLNVAQEIVQTEGNRNWAGVIQCLKKFCQSVKFPVVVKETGSGISGAVAKQLEEAGVAAIDVAGAGGTCWVRVEQYRGSVWNTDFAEWGIPTAEALRQCSESVSVPLIASGGIRTGEEVAKAIAIGASMVGLALPMLKPAVKSAEAVEQKLAALINELKAVMFLVGARNLDELRKLALVAK